MPTLPVNILSTRVLSQQFTGENGINLHGSGIHSCYENHTLIWDHGKYRKTFKTHASGLPECLFNSGYSRLEMYSTLMLSYYNDGINWAFLSTTKNKVIAKSDDEIGIAIFDGNTVTLNIPLTVQNMSSFLQGMKLRYNYGNGTRDIFCSSELILLAACNSNVTSDFRMIPQNLLILRCSVLSRIQTLLLSREPQKNIAKMPQIYSLWIWSIY